MYKGCGKNISESVHQLVCIGYTRICTVVQVEGGYLKCFQVWIVEYKRCTKHWIIFILWS